jgi:hypothetical protein
VALLRLLVHVCLILDTLWDYSSTRISVLADTSVGTGHAVAFRTNYLRSLQKSGAHQPQCVTVYRVNTTVVGSLLALLQTVAKSNNYPPHVCPSVLLFIRIEENQSYRTGLLQIIFGVCIRIFK